MRIYNLQKLKERRKELRARGTKEEKFLWEKLKTKRIGFKFRRQHSIGPYITDFYCAEKNLVIELDGNQHLSAREYDLERDMYFESLDLKVLRFWNNEIRNNLESVINKILNSLK